MESWRIRVFQHWLAGRRNNTGFLEMLGVVLDPTLGRKARQYIDRIDDADGCWRVQMRGISRGLYFPKSLGMYPLEQLIVELFHPSNWHYYEIPQTRLRADDIVLDCGAAEGLFTLKAEPICRRAFAAEPMPSWIDALRKTFAGSTNVEILPYAVSDSSGPLRMQEGGLDSTITKRETGIPVEARTVDSLFADQGRELTYLKADLEGAELAMLVGAERTIRANKPRIAITTYHRADHAACITEFLRRIDPSYQILTKGIEYRAGAPVMLHAWVD